MRVGVAKDLEKGAWSTQGTRISVTGLFALMCAAGCAMLSGVPNLDTPDGRVYAQRWGATTACEKVTALRGKCEPFGLPYHGG